MTESGKHPVQVVVQSRQRMKSGEKLNFQTRAPGLLVQKGAALYLSYREEEEQGLGSTLTTLRVEGRTLTLMRQGDTMMKQVLVKGEEQQGQYVTPYGTFDLTTRTSELVLALGPTGGHVSAVYNLKLGGEKSRMELRIDVMKGDN